MTELNDYDDLAALLPLYVNGSLGKRARNRIDAALKKSPQLRAALSHEQELKQRLVDGTDALLEDSAAGVGARQDALVERIETRADSADILQPVTQLSSNTGGALAFLNPRNWRPAVSMALALAVPALAGIAVWQATTISALEKENYNLASGPGGETPVKGAILIEFKDDVRWIEIQELLSKENLSIYKQAEFGAVTVKSGKEGAEWLAIVDRLRLSHLVSNVGPAA